MSHLEVHFKSKLNTCTECSQQFDALDLFLAHLIQQHQVYDRELLQLIKSKNVLDLSRFHIDPEKLNRTGGGVSSRYNSFNLTASGSQNGANGGVGGADSFYDMNDEDYLDDEDNFDDMEGEMGEEDLDSNGQDSNEYAPVTGMGKDGEMSYVQNSSMPPANMISNNINNNNNNNNSNKSIMSNINFDTGNNQSIFFDNDDLDTVIPSIGLADNDLDIDFAD
jgi:hypothetical protein